MISYFSSVYGIESLGKAIRFRIDVYNFSPNQIHFFQDSLAKLQISILLIFAWVLSVLVCLRETSPHFQPIPISDKEEGQRKERHMPFQTYFLSQVTSFSLGSKNWDAIFLASLFRPEKGSDKIMVFSSFSTALNLYSLLGKSGEASQRCLLAMHSHLFTYQLYYELQQPPFESPSSNSMTSSAL